MKLAIVIPVYNEVSVIKKVIEELPSKIKGVDKITILAVNDGSTDGSEKEILKTQAKLINLPINLGYGGASVTGLEGATKMNADLAVTFDGDGQHDPNDIAKVVQPILNGKAEIVIGTRFKKSGNIPILKKIGIRIMNLATFLVSGYWATDSQCGLKAFSAKALKKMDLEFSGMEFSSEIIMEAKRKRLKIAEVSANIIYTPYSRRKGQSVFNGINIILKLIYKRMAR